MQNKKRMQNLIENECQDFENQLKCDTLLIKMSEFFSIKTSPALTPYYSYRVFPMLEKNSTSHTTNVHYFSRNL